ncbi:uncharacterized protein BP5553_00854 [Venustampulla echinocandica]|uniref:GH64 domain-containing protein n=1 Tax=Venustampulla echinocandica TaxID=2656787 RepID=A0A370TZD1_9HELO|nr:uncharacterized protein BP5553_00854 [Venustampulla echinocandica]RDL40875.1 hypothetical protein BP5553_00854 [Venustampulla echinocandica]
MTTLSDVLQKQRTHGILEAPEIIDEATQSQQLNRRTTAPTLEINLTNATTSNTVYAYVTGLALDHNSSVFLLQSDGLAAFYPDNPTEIGTKIPVECAIPLGAAGTNKRITIPHLAGARIWFCVGNKLHFLTNPGKVGPGLVEPSVSNTADPNYGLDWGFCELTYNDQQLYANISYVDFVSLPISLTCTSTNGNVAHVGGLPANGRTNVCNGLIAQNASDGAGWDQLVVRSSDGSFLRALSPSNGIVLNQSLFQNYWTDYLNQVWTKYASEPLTIDTQSQWGKVKGYTSNDRTAISFQDIGSIKKPSALDIFGADSGAFAPQPKNTAALLNIGARIDAGINRSTLLLDSIQPHVGAGSNAAPYYTGKVTNHYARIVHAANVDGRGYAFPYDDVSPGDSIDASGFVSDGSPANLLIAVGGANAYKRKRDVVPTGMKEMRKRDIGLWDSGNEKALLRERDEQEERQGNGDLEKGLLLPLDQDPLQTETQRKSLQKLLSAPLTFLRTKNPAAYARILEALSTLTSVTVRAVAYRICLVIFCFFLYLLGGMRSGSEMAAARVRVDTGY